MFLKIFLPKALNFLLPVSILSGGSYIAYEVYWPKTIGEWLERDGHVPIGENEGKKYEAMYLDNKDLVPELPISRWEELEK